MNMLLLIGSYTRPEAHVPAACGEGILTCALDSATGALSRVRSGADMI